MDHHSILDQNLPAFAVEGNVPGTSAPRSAPPSVSAGIAAANAHQPKAEAGPRFPAEDGGRSLAAMAYRDLDAALQLLAERAQYITGASGAMIALRRGEHNDMLCRASAGSNAPELGALFSMEYGFSGESVRTCQALRCDDAEHDPRVNREGCRQLGIASVVVMPVVSDQQVLGVFELFSGMPRAFDERALSALRRLSEMVETAVKYAVAAQTVSAIQDQAAAEEILSPMDDIKLEVETVESEVVLATEELLSAPAPATRDHSPSKPQPSEPHKSGPERTEPEKLEPSPTELLTTEPLTTEPQKAELKTAAELTPKKPLFWSAAMQTPGAADPAAEAAASASVPAVLRNLHKCQACGFPVSQGRTFCVECEEKQWRGQRLPQKPASPVAQSQHDVSHTTAPASTALGLKDTSPTQPGEIQSAAPIKGSMREQMGNHVPAATIAVMPDKPLTHTSEGPSRDIPSLGQDVPQNKSADARDNSTLFLSSAVQPESWFAANKYILGALIVVAIVIAAVILLR